MSIREKPLDAKSSLKSTRENWPKVRFGDVVCEVKATIHRETTDLTRFIAGEHMGSEDLHLRTWGDVNGDYLGPAFHRSFRKGQVLYGSRRTYLKKVAVASFDGICANTTFVLESRDPNVLLPELLPFIMLTDAFTHHSIRESKGSVNPYINWKDIAKYEFPLPPKDEQRRIADILWAADEGIERFLHVQTALAKVFKVAINEIVQPNSLPADWRLVTINDLVYEGVLNPPQDGNHGELHPKASDYVESGIPFIMANNVRNRRVDLLECSYLPKSLADSLRIGFARTGDILLTHKGTLGELAIVPSLDTEYIMLTPQVTYYRVLNPEVLDRDFLYYSMMSDRFHKTLKLWSAQSTRAFLGIVAQRQLPIALPSIDTQLRVALVANKIERQIDSVNEHVAVLQNTRSSLRQRLLGGDQ
jgi:type I restriction enzyme S subunit